MSEYNGTIIIIKKNCIYFEDKECSLRERHTLDF